MEKRPVFLVAALAFTLLNCGGRARSEGGAASQGGAGGAMGSAGSASAGGGLAEGGASPCIGSLEAVSQALGSTCPSTLCEANVWAIVSCSSLPKVVGANAQYCDAFYALNIDIGASAHKTCVYTAPTDRLLDGMLVGAFATDTGHPFCDGASDTIRAGQQVPGACARGSTLCSPASSSNGQAGAPGGAGAGTPVEACVDAFSSSCAPCCPDTPPDCSDKPDGYPGYPCTPKPTSAGASFCSCTCGAGEWQCGC